MSRSASRTTADELTMEAIVAGDLQAADVRIGAEALVHQAEVAEAGGNAQLGENLRRAAELTVFTDAEVLGIYDALRPGRSSAEELERLAVELGGRGAPLCARLVSEAQAVYDRRGLLGPP